MPRLPETRRLALEHLAHRLRRHVCRPRRANDIARAVVPQRRALLRRAGQVRRRFAPHFDDYASIEGWEHWEAVPHARPRRHRHHRPHRQLGAARRATSPAKGDSDRGHRPAHQRLASEPAAGRLPRPQRRAHDPAREPDVEPRDPQDPQPARRPRAAHRPGHPGARRSRCRSSAAWRAPRPPPPPWRCGATCRSSRSSPSAGPKAAIASPSCRRSTRRNSGDRRRDIVELTRRVQPSSRRSHPAEPGRMGVVAQALAPSRRSPGLIWMPKSNTQILFCPRSVVEGRAWRQIPA